MTTTTQDSMVWHNDGHIMHLQLTKHELTITHVTCPGGDDAACVHPKVGCMVDFFLGLYGLDCNVGIAEPNPSMQIAWTLVGDTYEIETAQIWVIPINDEAFSAWLLTQN